MTTVANFVSYYLRRLWREGDQDLTSDLPNIVKEAEARMSRDIRENSIVKDVTLPYTSENFDLPADLNEIHSVSLDGYSPAALVLPDEIFRIRRVTAQGRSNVYALSGNKLMTVAGAAPVWPRSAKLVYSMRVPPAPMDQPDAEMGFYDLNPDYFLAALDVQVYAYMREFELSAEKNGVYAALLDTMIRNSNYARWPSGQLDPWASLPRSNGRTFT